MAADSWTITGGTRDVVYVNVTISDVVYPFQVAVAGLDISTNQTALAGIRAAVTSFRDGKLAALSTPARITAAIGFTEVFA